MVSAQGRPAAADRPPTAEVDFSPREPVRPLSVEEQRQSLVLQPGFQIAPVLTEPIIAEPTQIAFDGNGRMFVLELRTYMQDADATGELEPGNRISMHDDTDNDDSGDGIELDLPPECLQSRLSPEAPADGDGLPGILAEGPDWFTWDPVLKRRPGRGWRRRMPVASPRPG